MIDIRDCQIIANTPEHSFLVKDNYNYKLQNKLLVACIGLLLIGGVFLIKNYIEDKKMVSIL